MSEPRNIANAAMIIAGIYLLIEAINGWLIAVGIVLIIFGLGTWGYFHVTEDHKRLLKMQIEEAGARTRNFNAHTAFMTTQSAHAIKGLKH